jgi:hypothetical protein
MTNNIMTQISGTISKRAMIVFTRVEGQGGRSKKHN